MFKIFHHKATWKNSKFSATSEVQLFKFIKTTHELQLNLYIYGDSIALYLGLQWISRIISLCIDRNKNSYMSSFLIVPSVGKKKKKIA